MKENNKQKYLTIIAVITLVALVSGATYAYFAVGTTNNFGTSTINATADSIGSVVLNGEGAQLEMDLSAVDMMRQTNSITYYASSDNKTTTPTEETIAVASVLPTTDTNYYHCEYTLSVTHTGTKDMYTEFNRQTNEPTYDYTNRSFGQIILTVNGVDYDWASQNGMPSTIQGEFDIHGTEEVEITAGLRLINLSNVDQTYLAGTDVSITIALQQNSFTCVAQNPPVISYWTYEGSFSNPSFQDAYYQPNLKSSYNDLVVWQYTDASGAPHPYSSEASCNTYVPANTQCTQVVQPYFIKQVAFVRNNTTYVTSYELCIKYNNNVICHDSTATEEEVKTLYETAGLTCKYNTGGSLVSGTWSATKQNQSQGLYCFDHDPSTSVSYGDLVCKINQCGVIDAANYLRDNRCDLAGTPFCGHFQ